MADINSVAYASAYEQRKIENGIFLYYDINRFWEGASIGLIRQLEILSAKDRGFLSAKEEDEMNLKKGKLFLFVLSVLLVLVFGMAGCDTGDTGTTTDKGATDTSSDASASDTGGGGTATDASGEGTASDTGDGAAASSDLKTEGLKIGVSYLWIGDDYMKNMQAELQKLAAEKGIELIEKNAEQNAEVQQASIEDLTEMGVDAIIYQPNDATTGIPAAQKAIDKGIPIITINTVLDGGPGMGIYESTTDGVQAGFLAGEYLCNALLKGKGNIVILDGTYGSSVTTTRREGFDASMSLFPEVKLLYDDTADWGREDAYEKMSNWIQTSGDKINGVLAASSEMAIGALKACEDAGLKGIQISTIDNSEETDQLMEEGRIQAVVDHDSPAEADAAIEMAIQLANSQTPPLQTVYVPHALITPANLADFKGRMQSFEA